MVNYKKIENLKHKRKSYPAILRYLDQELEYEKVKNLNLELAKLKEKGIIDYKIRKLQNSKSSIEIWSKKGGIRDEIDNLFHKYGLLFACSNMKQIRG